MIIAKQKCAFFLRLESMCREYNLHEIIRQKRFLKVLPQTFIQHHDSQRCDYRPLLDCSAIEKCLTYLVKTTQVVV